MADPTPTEGPPDDLLVVGKVVGAQGLKGELGSGWSTHLGRLRSHMTCPAAFLAHA